MQLRGAFLPIEIFLVVDIPKNTSLGENQHMQDLIADNILKSTSFERQILRTLPGSSIPQLGYSEAA